MDPIILVALWEYAVKPVVDSAKKEYGDTIKEKIKLASKNLLSKLPFEKNEIEVIETEIVELDEQILLDKNNFIDFLNKNNKIIKILEDFNNREPNINIDKELTNITIHGNVKGVVTAQNGSIINQTIS